MATRFELVLYGGDEVRLRAAGEDALSEIVRLDRQLSFYRAASDVSWINAHAGDGPVRVEPGLFGLLERCQALAVATDGAFDITIAPLMRAWRFVSRSAAVPDGRTLAAARGAVGSCHLHLDPAAWTIAFQRPGMSIDLGGAGKGYAIDAAIRILREHGVAHALLHGGTSSVHTIGTRPDGSPWRIAWNAPQWRADGERASAPPPVPPPDCRVPMEPRTFALRDGALAVSAIHGKSFVAGGREYGHVMDPRTGLTTMTARAAAVTGPGSLECDALSTALLVLGPGWLHALRARFPAYDGAVD
jgi:FAD:protein FMN transferase